MHSGMGNEGLSLKFWSIDQDDRHAQYVVKTIKNLLWNLSADDPETRHVAFDIQVHQSLFK